MCSALCVKEILQMLSALILILGLLCILEDCSLIHDLHTRSIGLCFKMPFIIQPPDNHETSQKLAVIVRDQNEQEMLQDLHNWGWTITGFDFSNEQFMEALNYIDKTANKKRRRTPYTANQTQYPTERPTLLQIWRKEGKKKFQPRPWPHQIPDEQPIPAPIEEPIPKHIIEAEKYVSYTHHLPPHQKPFAEQKLKTSGNGSNPSTAHGKRMAS